VHPNLAAVYRKKVEELGSLLDDAEHRDEAMELIRSLIEKIELSPREEGGGLTAIWRASSLLARREHRRRKRRSRSAQSLCQVPDKRKPSLV
jgi:hypothetical protein